MFPSAVIRKAKHGLRKPFKHEIKSTQEQLRKKKTLKLINLKQIIYKSNTLKWNEYYKKDGLKAHLTRGYYYNWFSTVMLYLYHRKICFEQL